VLRVALALLERMLPITQIMEFAGEMTRRMRQQGLVAACTVSAARLGLECEFDLSDYAQKVLGAESVIVYGNHPTILTPFLVASAAGRDDMRFFIVDYVIRLIPSFGKYALPLRVPAVRARVEWRRGGIKRVISRRLARVFVSREARVDARQANQRALSDGVRHLEQGGCVVIFPGGGGREVERWYPGIGRLVEEVRGHRQAHDVFLLPMHEDTRSEAHVYGAFRRLARGTSSRAGHRLHVRVRFAEPKRLQEFIPPDASCDEIIRKLQADYEATYPRRQTDS